MTFIEISELLETLNIDDNSVFPLVYQGETKKITFKTLKRVFQYFNSVSFNSSTGEFIFGMSNNANAILTTDFNNLLKDVSISGNTITFVREDNSTFNVNLDIDLAQYAKQKDLDALEDRLDIAEEDIDEIEEILYSKEEIESTDNKVVIEKGNPELEMALSRLNGGISQDTRDGYNILEGIIENKTANGITITKNEDNSYKVSGTATAVALFSTNINTKLIANKTYVIGFGNSNSNVQISIRPSNGSTQYANTTTTKFVTYTPTENLDVRLFVRIANGSSVNETIYPIIYEGTTEKPYEQYGQMPSPSYPSEIKSVTGEQEVVIRGINEFDISQIEIGKAWNTGSNTARAVCYMNCEPNTTYTISFNDISNFDGMYWVEKSSKDNTTSLLNTPILATRTITTNANSGVICIQFNKNNISLSDFEGVKIMINEGSTALPYEPYITPITKTIDLGDLELFENGFISYEDTVFYWNDNYKKVVLDGTETWGVGVNKVYYTDSIKDYAISNNIPYSNYYKGVTNVIGASNMDMRNNNTIAFINGTTNFRFYIKDESQPTTTALTQWLSTHNVEVVYKLETPTKTKITNTTLIQQLEALLKLQQLNGTTIIEITSEDGLNPSFRLLIENDTISILKNEIGDISAVLDVINGEVI